MQANRPNWCDGLALSADESDAPNEWTGLVGHWAPSLGVQGAQLYDVSGYANHGTLTAMTLASAWVTTPWGLALDFDGSDDYVSVPSSAALSPDSGIAISLWVRRSRVSTREIITGKGAGGGAADSSFWVEFNASNQIEFYLSQGGTTDRWQTSTLVVSDTTTLHHIVGTYDGATQRIYLDAGAPAASVWSGSLGTNAQPFAIGRLGSLATLNFQGLITDVRLYNRALSAADVFAIYADPFARYRLWRRPVVSVPAVVGGGPRINSLLLAGMGR